MCQELAHGDSFFALLRELRPVLAHPLFVVEPAPRVGDGERHGGQALGGRVDEDHGVLLPRLARLLVSNTAPQVDDLLATVKGAASSAQLATPKKVISERFANGFEAWADVPLDSKADIGRCMDDDFRFGHTYWDHAACSISLGSRSARQFQDCGTFSLAYTSLFMSNARDFL